MVESGRELEMGDEGLVGGPDALSIVDGDA